MILRWMVEVNREDLERNDIGKPPEEWEASDLAHADSLGLIYAWEVEVEEPRPRRKRQKLGDIESVPLKGRSHPYG